MLRAVFDDVRSALRAVIHARGISSLIILTVALGVGANTGVFGVLHSALLTPLPYAEPDRLVRLRLDRDDGRYLPGAAFIELRDASRAVDMASVFTYTEQGIDLTGSDRPERVASTNVSSNYFRVLGVHPLVGRSFERHEERAGNRVALVSERIWRQYLAGDAAAIGRPLDMSGVPVQVIGVLPSGFHDPMLRGVEVWFPDNLQPGATNSWGNNRLTAIGRLRDGFSIDAAIAEGRVLVAAQGAKYGSSVPRGLTVVPLQQDIAGPAGPMLYVLMGAVALLLLLACTNVATLLLTRGAARAQELALRSALGSGRGRLARQMLAESLLLSLAGGLLGLLLARVAATTLAAGAPVPLVDAGAPGFGGAVYAYGLAITVLTGIVFGLAPALQASRPDLERVLRENARGSTGSPAQRFASNALVAAQVAVALVLLVGAGLLLRSYHNLRTQPLGVEPSGVTAFTVQLPSGRYDTADARAAFHRLLHERLSTVPGVRAAGAISRLPLTGTYHSWGARRVDADLRVRDAEQRVIEGDYFGAMGIRLLQGRTFTSVDRPDSARAAVVSRSLADALFPGEDAIGREIAVLNFRATVIGIVSDVPLSVRGEPAPTVYHAHAQFADNRNWVLAQVVSAATGGDAAGAIAREVARLDPRLVVHDLRRFDEVVAEGRARERFALRLLGVFAALAVCLASIGVFGVLAHAVAARRKELAIRLALGATPAMLRHRVLARGASVAATGAALGALGAFALSRWVRTLLFGVAPADPLVFLGAAATVLLIAVAAAWLPARAATAANPAEALH